MEQYARKAIQLNPRLARAYAVLGIFYREVAGLNWFERAFASTLAYGLPEATYEDSEKMLLKAIELDPSSLFAHYQLALTYEKTGRLDQERAILKKGTELRPLNGFELTLQAEARRKLQITMG